MPLFSSASNVSSFTRRTGGQLHGGGGAAAALLNGLLAFWQMEESNANRADATGNGNTLTDRSTTGSTTGKDGSAANFSTDYMDADFLTGVTTFSISCWVYFNGTSQGVFISKNNFNTNPGAGFYIQHNGSSKITFSWYTGSGTTSVDLVSSINVTSGTWYHVVATYDAATQVGRLVVNGTNEASLVSVMAAPPSNLFTVGRFASAAPLSFAGRMDMLGVWNRVLSQSEILSLYNAGTPVTYPFTGLAQTAAYSGGYNVIWIVNQSNAIGWAAGANNIDRIWPAGTKQIGRVSPNAGAMIDPFHTATTEGPLEFNETDASLQTNNTASLGLALARLYYANVDSSKPILIVPSAAGSTGFTDNRWNPGDALYEAELARLNAAMALNASNELVLIYSAWGEQEVGTATSEAAAAALWDAFHDDVRSRATGAAGVPWIVGGMNPTWVASATDYSSAQKTAIQNAIADTPNRKTYTAYADPSAAPAQTGTDNVHYAATGYRGTDGLSGMALKIINAIPTALANV